MSVILTTHFLPGFDENNPTANDNLYVVAAGDPTPLLSPLTLSEGIQYQIYVDVRNDGDSNERRAGVDFMLRENGGDFNPVGDTVHFEIASSETVQLLSSDTFSVIYGNSYDLVAIVQGRNDPYSGGPEPADRHVAWQEIVTVKKDVKLTLQDGIGPGTGSIGQNPNLYLVDESGVKATKPGKGKSYTIRARVVNQGRDADAVQVQFFSKKSGHQNPIGSSEVAVVQGHGGEYVFSFYGWVYSPGQNELVAVCSTLSYADQYDGKNLSPSDRHVGQFNVN